MAIKAVIWDYGGVLVRTEDLGPRQKLADKLQISIEELTDLVFNSPNAIKAAQGELSGEIHWQQVGQALGVDAQILRKEFFAGDVLDEELMRYIRSLRPTYRVGLLSNAFDQLRRQIEQAHKIADAFDESLISAEVGLMKPDAAIYELILQRMRLEPRQVVFIDDFVENVAGAQQVGMQAIHFRSREQAQIELAELLDH